MEDQHHHAVWHPAAKIDEFGGVELSGVPTFADPRIKMSATTAAVATPVAMSPREAAGPTSKLLPQQTNVLTYVAPWTSDVQHMKSKIAGMTSGARISKKLQQFYREQDELVNQFDESARMLESGEAPLIDTKKITPGGKLALKMSIFFNVIILASVLFVAIESRSLAVLASAFETVMDLGIGIVLAVTAHLISNADLLKYPQGRARLEPVASIVLSSLMGMVSLNVIIEGIKRIVGDPAPTDLTIADYVILGFVLATKTTMFLICRRFENSMVQTQALDHRNDILISGLGTTGAILGSRVWPYLDPIIAICFSLFVISSWARTARENMQIIVGKSAPQKFLQQVTFLAMHHDERIVQIDTVRAFHFGVNFLVEVDIILPKEMSVGDSHDIGESLQNKLERLPEVDRAFVHVDFEGEHRPEHKTV